MKFEQLMDKTWNIKIKYLSRYQTLKIIRVIRLILFFSNPMSYYGLVLHFMYILKVKLKCYRIKKVLPILDKELFNLNKFDNFGEKNSKNNRNYI